MTDDRGHDRLGTTGTGMPSPDQSSHATGDVPTWWEVGDALWLAAYRERVDPPALASTGASADHRPDATAAGSPALHQVLGPRTGPEPGATAPADDDAGSTPLPERGEGPVIPMVMSPATQGFPSIRSGESGIQDTVMPTDPMIRSLGDRQALTRAVGWLRRHRASAKRVVDERATAEDFAARALAAPRKHVRRTPVLPKLSATGTPADELVLLLDDSLSMRLQQPVVAALTDLLAPIGVFAGVRILSFDSDKAQADDLDVLTPNGKTIDPHRLVDGNGHEIILVLTDSIGDGWRTGAVASWLAMWGRSAVVGIGHLLDRERWPRTAIRPHQVVIGAGASQGEILIPNDAYQVRPRSPHAPRPALPASATAIPVVPMEPSEMGRWARFVSQRTLGDSYVGTVLAAEPEPWLHDPPAEPGDSGAFPEAGMARTPLSADDLVTRFRAAAPPTAFHLAVCLAAVPLTMPMIRTVQEEFAPESRLADLTEVVCSGLIRRRDGALTLGHEDEIPFEFQPGVRELLMATGGRRHEIHRLVAATADRYRGTIPWFAEVRRLLLGHASEHPLPAVDDATAAYADAIDPGLRALPGPIRAAAGQWRRPTNEGVHPLDGPDHDSAATADAEHPPDAAPPPTIRSTPNDKDSDMPSGDASATQSSERAFADQPSEGLVSDETRPDGPEQGGRPRDSGGVASRTSRHRPGIWGQIPSRNVNFVGREGLLHALRVQLRRESAAAVLPEASAHALQGMGGVGKTQLALEYAWRYRAEYDLVWWIPAETPAQVQQSLIDLGSRLGVDVGDPAATVRSVLDALRTGEPRANWLLIYDNAADPAALDPFIPSAGPGQVLITSRSTEWRTASSGLIQVDTFERAESTQLLLRRGPSSLTAQDADLISDRLGDLPLAVAQTAVWLYETMMPPAEWLALFDEKAHELLSSALPSPEYPRSVAATMDMTLDHLRDNNRGALLLMQVCAFLAPQPIPRRLFNGTRNIDAPDALADILADPAITLSRALRTIDRFALIKMDHRNETFQLHRLVQDTLKLRLTPEERVELQHCAHQLLANLDPGDPFSTRDWPRYVELLPHVWATELWRCESPWVRQLVLGEMHFLALWGGYTEGEELGTRTIADWQERLGAEDIQTLRAERRYVQLLRMLGLFRDAYDRNRAIVATLARTRGRDDEETLEAHINLSWDLRNIGQFQEAVVESTDVFERYQRMFGRDDVLTLFAAHVHTVGLRLTGRYAEAMEIDRYNLERRLEMVGPEHGLTRGARHAYALDLMEAGRYWESEPELEEQLELDTRFSDANNPSRLITMLILSTVKRRVGRLTEAVALSEEAYRLFEERLGPDNHDTVLAAASHSVSLRATGDHESALNLSTRARERYLALYGAHHPLYADVSVNHAVILRLLGQVTQAREIDQETLRIHTDLLGPDHPSTIANAINLASDLFAVGDAAAAYELDTATHERAQATLGENHPLTLAVYRNLLIDRGTVEGASLGAERADIVARYRAVFGPEHPATLAAGQDVRANCDLHMNLM